MIRDEYRTPFIWEQKDVFGVDFSCTNEQCSNMVRGSHYYHGIAPYQVEKILSASQSVLAFDLQEVGRYDMPKTIHLTRIVETDGRLDGFALFFKVNFDDEIFFSNSPLAENTSWQGRLLRVSSKYLRKGQSIEFEMSMEHINDPNSWHWSGG